MFQSSVSFCAPIIVSLPVLPTSESADVPPAMTLLTPDVALSVWSPSTVTPIVLLAASPSGDVMLLPPGYLLTRKPATATS